MTFEDWFHEPELFGLRSERFDGDVAWLRAAWEAGRGETLGGIAVRDLSELLNELRSEPAYPECCEQAADEIEHLTRQLAEAREALLALVLCPCISERDMEPAWLCTETDEAERLARAVLARLDAEEPKP